MDTISPSRLYLQDTAFHNLMQKRIFNVLLIASDYDAFMLEEDGRVEEQLFFEYVSLNLSSPPRVTRVANTEEALELMKTKKFDIVFTMPGTNITEALNGARKMKSEFPDVPIILLTPFSHEVSRRLSSEDLTVVDFVFSWLGNVDLFLAVIKLLEDRMNADNDIGDVGVQMILLVEDSVRFYSSVLPTIYKFLLNQSVSFATEALNRHEQMLRMRGRPKVMLARDYEEALALYDKYNDKILGVISDVSFMHNGKKDSKAGLKLANEIHSRDPYLPIIIESSESENAEKVDDFNGTFVDKNSKKLSVDLGDAITEKFGFGDFIVRNPEDGSEIMRLTSLKDLQKRLYDIPDESLYYHSSKNEFSRWLYSRAMFPIARVLKNLRFTNLSQAPKVREIISDAIIKYRKMKNRGVVAVYERTRFDHYSNFARIGEGSLGGKARGLAFIDSIIKKKKEFDNFKGCVISIPRTVVLCTDIFDEFMADNNLYQVALSTAADEVILHHFLEAELPPRLIEDFLSLFDVVDRPLAVRSSSLLEDSHYQPFAGVYSTYMVPRSEDKLEMLSRLSDAVKGVYASVFYAESKAYMNATRNVIDQEKMAIIIQEVVGEQVDDVYFPSFSGVGRSLNYYPVGSEKSEDGIVQVAVGLGKHIVDGGTSLRFCPKYPRSVVQTSTLEMALKSTQTRLEALETEPKGDFFSADDNLNITTRNIQDFAGKTALNFMVSTYDAINDIQVDNNTGPGRRLATFANILNHNVFPLAEAVQFMLETGQQAMGRPVEIEFAGTLNKDLMTNPQKGNLYWLQIRPIIDKKDIVSDSLLNVPDTKVILRSDSALGHGLIDTVSVIVYVKPQSFDSLSSRTIAAQIAEINAELISENKPYVLIGPGRWGTSDPMLGIPVRWTDISNARIVVESALVNFNVEPSQGTHFFQNLTSFGVGYITINPFVDGGGYYDIEYLNSLPAVKETEFIRVLAFDSALTIGIDGVKGKAVILKPSDLEESPNQNDT